MKMAAFLQFSDSYRIQDSQGSVCVHTRARAHVCVFDKKMIGTHAFTFYGKPAVDMLWTYLTVSLGTLLSTSTPYK